MTEARQVFKNRVEAHRYLQAEQIAVSRSKFYDDCEHYRLVQPDKSIHLADLLAYVKRELKTNAVSGQRLSELDMALTKEAADARKAVADADKAEMQAEAMRRELDKQWIRREAAEEETCVWVSRLRDAVAYHLSRDLPAIILACGGNPARQAETQARLDAAMAAACNEIANAEEITVDIEDLEDL